MATPWEQAQDFVRSHWRLLDSLTKGRRPTRPLNVLEKIANAWTGAGLDLCEMPAWVFMYLPKGNGLFEWADNVAPAQVERELLGRVKLQSLVSDGGMVFSAAWCDGRLNVSAVALVRSQKLFVFDRADGLHPPLTPSAWDRYLQG